MPLEEDLRRQLDTLTDRIRDDVAERRPAGARGLMASLEGDPGVLADRCAQNLGATLGGEITHPRALQERRAQRSREGSAIIVDAGWTEVLVPVRGATGYSRANVVRTPAGGDPLLLGLAT